nr:NADH dehydrogenase subunit 2 [Cupuladria biporosa]
MVQEKIFKSKSLFHLTGISLTMSTNNWLTTWIGLEMTLMGFLPMITPNHTSVEGMIKYFLIQAGGSSLFLLSFLMLWKNTHMLTPLSMMLKLGVFPFHQWVPAVMSSLSWTSCIILTTLQKIAPMMILMNLNTSLSSTLLIMMMSAQSIYIGGQLGYNQLMMRPFMAYSSISHTGWMTLTTTQSINLCLMYMAVYFLMNYITLMNLKKINMNKTMSNKIKKESSINMMMLIMTGIPPSPMFFMKMMIISNLFHQPLILLIALTGSILSYYFYLTFIIPNLMKKSTNSFTTKNSNISMTSICMMTTLLMLI